MKLKYYKEDDILIIRFSEKPVEDSYEAADNTIMEVDKNNEPVSLEILHASEFLKKQSKVLPKEVKKALFSSV